MEVSFQSGFLPKLKHPSFVVQQWRFPCHGGFLFVLSFKSGASWFFVVKLS